MDRREFTKSLEAYYREKGKPPPPLEPQLAGKAISLYLLFERVTKLGGSHVIGKEDKWQDILQASLAYGLRKIYKQYLESFEKLQLYGEEPREEDEEDHHQVRDLFSDISETRRIRDDAYSQSYDRHVRRKLDHSTTQYAHITHDPNYQSRFKPEPPEWRMINSLQSCLPNEVNFVLNTLLLYCSDHHRKRLRLERCPHLLDALMLHAGCPTNQDHIIYQQWQENSGLRLTHFWEEKLNPNHDLKLLLGMEPVCLADGDKKSGGFISGEKDREGQRIRHILVIIRNICQDQRDVHIVRRSEPVLRFILRCAFIQNDVGLVEQALETISVILQSDKSDRNMNSPVWVEEPYISLVLELISRLIRRPDKLIQIRILEIYAQLLEQTIVESGDDVCAAPTEDFESVRQRDNDKKANYLRTIIPDLTDHILPMLTLPDCELLIASLEALNAVARSPLGDTLCQHERISVLVDLLSFSSRNCDFSRLRFYGPRQPETSHPPLIVTPRIPRRVLPPSTSAAPPQPPPSSSSQSASSNSQQPNQQPHVNSPNRQPPPRPLQLQQQPNRANTPVKMQRTATPIKDSIPEKSSAKEEQSTIINHQWSFARSFIQRRLELADSDNSMISRQGIFLEYTSMAKQQGKIDGVSGVPILNVPEFTRLIREVFPTSQLINDSHSRQVFSGIRVKDMEPEKPIETGKSGKLSNGVIRRETNGYNGTSSPVPTPTPKENGHSNGVVSYDEDSNHSQKSLDSQQSLDSVGGGKLSHNSVKPKAEVPPEISEKELTNGKCEETSVKSELKETQKSIPPSSTPPTSTDSMDQIDKPTQKHSNGTSELSEEKETTDTTNNSVNGHSDKENDHENKDAQNKQQNIANGSVIKVTLNNSKKRPNHPETESTAKDQATPPKQRIVTQGAPAGLRVLLQNAGTFLFDDFTDDREDCLTRSVRIQSALVLLTLTEHSFQRGKRSILPLVSRYEERISLIAASRQDASPVLARLLAFIP